MRIADSRSPGGIGFLPLQDFSWRGSGIHQSDRCGVFAIRVRGRRETGQDGIGHWIEDVETRGDLTGWLCLTSPTGSRAPSGWRATPWPARYALMRDDPDLDATAIFGPGGRTPTGPKGEIPPNSRPPSDTVTTPKDDDKVTPSKSDGLPPEKTASATIALQERPIIVTLGKGETRNWDYSKIKHEGNPKGPKHPGGIEGVCVASTDDHEQRLYFRPTDRRLVASHRSLAVYGGTLHDTTKDADIDEERYAYLQTALRVLRKPGGDLGLAGNTLHSIAFNIGLARQGEGLGGFVSDGKGDEPRVGHLSVRNGGPIDAGGAKCVHRIGATENGIPIYPVHLSTKTFWRFTGGEYDGPLEFGTYWPDPGTGPYPVHAWIGFDAARQYKWPRDGGGKSAKGMYRLWSECYFYAPRGPTTDQPPGTPTTGTPGGGDPPGSPGGGGGGPTTPPTGPRGGGGGPTIGPGGGGGGGPTTGSGGGVQTQSSIATSPRPVGATLMELRVPGFALRAPWWGDGAPDLRYAFGADPSAADAVQPVVGRLAAFGRQGSTQQEWTYGQEPRSGRELGGTAAGGVVLLPPELDMPDLQSGFAPVGITASTTYFVAAPGVRIGYGRPHLSTGGLSHGVSLESDAAGVVRVYTHDASGTATELLRIESGTVTLADAADLVVGTTTGTKIGTAANEKLGFHGASPSDQNIGWTVTNPSSNKTLDVSAATLGDVRQVLGTLIDALKTKGLLGG